MSDESIDLFSWRQCTLLLRLLRATTAAEDIDALSQLLDSMLRELLGASWAALFSAEPDGTFLRRSSSPAAEAVLQQSVRGHEAEMLHVHSTGVLARSSGHDQLDAFPGAALALPIDHATHRVAWLVVGERLPHWGASFNASDAEFLSLVGGLVAPKLAYAKVMATQTLRSFTDELTGLGNRRASQQRIEEGIGSSNRTGRPLGLLSFQLDGVTKIEDARPAGASWSFRDLGETINSAIRASDVAFRDDATITVLLTNADAAGTRIAAERIRSALSRFGERNGIRLPASIGGAVLKEGIHSPVDLATVALSKKAEEAMYRAKRAGGDRSVIA